MSTIDYSKQLASDIEATLAKCGFLFRVFHRKKSPESIRSKINNNPNKYGLDKKIQDLIGIRVVLYFIDDIDSVKDELVKKYKYDEVNSTIDHPDADRFNATRYNLIFRLPQGLDFLTDYPDSDAVYLDNTFEVQIRTVFSEGWHEVEHDLRYKCKDEWCNYEKESRALNGVYATLETSEWTLMQIFDELAYKNYKSCNWSSMIKNKFRLRFSDNKISSFLSDILDEESSIAKSVYRYERSKLMRIFGVKHVPITMDNIIYFINMDCINDERINRVTPTFIYKSWAEISVVLEG